MFERRGQALRAATMTVDRRVGGLVVVAVMALYLAGANAVRHISEAVEHADKAASSAEEASSKVEELEGRVEDLEGRY